MSALILALDDGPTVLVYGHRRPGAVRPILRTPPAAAEPAGTNREPETEENEMHEAKKRHTPAQRHVLSAVRAANEAGQGYTPRRNEGRTLRFLQRRGTVEIRREPVSASGWWIVEPETEESAR